MLYQAQGKDWPEAVKITTLHAGLNSLIQHSLNNQLLLPDTYPKFLQAVQRLSSRSTAYGATQPNPDKMDISGVMISSLRARPVSPSHRASPVSPSRRARPVSPSQRAQWRKDGNCVRCGSQDHWVENCQLRPTVQPSRQSVSSRQLSRPSPVPGYYYPGIDNSDASNYSRPRSIGEITL